MVAIAEPARIEEWTAKAAAQASAVCPGHKAEPCNPYRLTGLTDGHGLRAYRLKLSSIIATRCKFSGIGIVTDLLVHNSDTPWELKCLSRSQMASPGSKQPSRLLFI